MATRHGFWIAASDNRVFDGIVSRHLIARGDIAAIHAFYRSTSYSFSDIVRRLKAPPSTMRVLFYTWAGRKLIGGDMIGAVPTLDGIESQEPDIRLKDAAGHVLTSDSEHDFVFLDPRIREARTWLSGRVRIVATRVGSDGVALDGAIRSPGFLDRIREPERPYPPDFDLMIKAISGRTGLTIFNNLSAQTDQAELLDVTDGASIERFGLNDTIARAPTFAADILTYLRIIKNRDNRTFLVFGRASRNETPYTTYDQDWQWQRYLYCAYLLVAGTNTRWKQHAGFLTSPFGGRAGGLDVYADALHDLGAPLGDYRVEGGCYQRGFERGLVLVVPAESRRSTTVPIVRPMYTPEGRRVSGSVTVARGEGTLLLQRLPVTPPALTRAFTPRTDPLWRWSALRQELDNWYLHLDATSHAEACEHDLALDLVRHRAPRGLATLSYRTEDPAARVETVVEVDDSGSDDPGEMARFALVDGALPVGGVNDTRPGQFRGVPPPASQFHDLPVIGGGTPMRPDGRWHTLAMNLDAACNGSSRYRFRRALFSRLLGTLDIRRMRLAGPVTVR